jgi:HAD superfamily hydrolase (TIGR01509 family)
MIDSVIFDMDGVLFDTERLYAAASHLVGKELNMNDIDASIKHTVGLNANDFRQFMLQKYGQQFPFDLFSRRLTDIFQDIVEKDGLPQKEGVLELLTYLETHGYKIALATSSGKKSTFRYLNQAGIAHFFQVVVTGDMITHGKPNPEIFRTACERLGSAPENCIAIEDSPNGIRSAHAAGLKVIMVPDLIEPTPDIEKLLFRKFCSLLDTKVYFESLNK